MFCYYVIAVPVGICFAFEEKFGVEGLRVGVLIGQLFLVSIYTMQTECMTNWQSVATEIQDRLYKENQILQRKLRGHDYNEYTNSSSQSMDEM